MKIQEKLCAGRRKEGMVSATEKEEKEERTNRPLNKLSPRKGSPSSGRVEEESQKRETAESECEKALLQHQAVGKTDNCYGKSDY